MKSAPPFSPEIAPWNPRTVAVSVRRTGTCGALDSGWLNRYLTGAGTRSSTDDELSCKSLYGISFRQTLPEGCRRPAPRPLRKGAHRFLRQSLRVENQRHCSVSQNGCAAHHLHVPVEAAQVLDHRLAIAHNLVHHK